MSAKALAGGKPQAEDQLRTQDELEMTPIIDPKKRPLLTPEQLRVIRQSLQVVRKDSQVKRKATPREEFENLFR